MIRSRLRLFLATAVGLPLVVGVLTVASPAAPAMAQTNQCAAGPQIQPVTFAQLDGRVLANNDRIVAGTRHNVFTQPPNSIRLGLQSSAAVTWYKEVRAEDAFGNILGSTSTEGSDHGPNIFTVNYVAVDHLFFLKAKFLGVHCAIYRMSRIELDKLQPQDETIFTWRQD
jgi:hypothetical protein